MRIGLITEGGYPYLHGAAGLWCNRLVRGLADHEFDVYALSTGARQEHDGWVRLPDTVRRVRTAPLWRMPDALTQVRHGRRARRRFAECYAELAAVVCAGYGPREPDGTVPLLPAPGGARQEADSTAQASRVRGRALPGVLRGVLGGAESAAPGAAESWENLEGRGGRGRRDDREAVETAGAGALTQADRFARALYALADFAADEGAPAALLRSETAIRILDRACRAPGARGPARAARVSDLLAVTTAIERVLRPLSMGSLGSLGSFRPFGSLDSFGSLGPGRSAGSVRSVRAAEAGVGDWYGGRALGDVDVCHATSGGPAAVAGLLAHYFNDVPLLVTEYGVALRSRYLTHHGGGAPERALLAAFHRQIAAETYRQAARVISGSARDRRWQERSGAARAKLRTVHPGIDATPFAAAGSRGTPGEPGALVWVGGIEPGKDLVTLLHAFAAVHRTRPATRLRIVGAPSARPDATAYATHCKNLAARLFTDAATGPDTAGARPVTFEDVGVVSDARLADAYAGARVVVRSDCAGGFPDGLVRAMFSGRATVSTDVGAVVDVIGGTGLVVPPRHPHALAEACLTLLDDPARCALLGAAAHARALELFSTEQNIAAFRHIYRDIAPLHPAPGSRPVIGTRAGAVGAARRAGAADTAGAGAAGASTAVGAAGAVRTRGAASPVGLVDARSAADVEGAARAAVETRTETARRAPGASATDRLPALDQREAHLRAADDGEPAGGVPVESVPADADADPVSGSVRPAAAQVPEVAR